MIKNKKIHILFIIENLSFPFDKRVFSEAKSLIKNGYFISVISPKGVKFDKDNYEVVEKIQVYRYGIKNNFNRIIGYVYEYFISYYNIMRLLIKINIKNKINIIHISNPPDIFFLLAIFCKLINIIFIFDQHDLTPETYLIKYKKNFKIIYNILILMEYLTFRTADYIISTNETFKNIALQRGKIKENKIQIIRNGPDKIFREPIKKKLKKTNYIKICYVGMMSESDGVINLIYSAQYLIKIKKIEKIRFYLIGDGDKRIEIEELIKKFRLKKYFKLTGIIKSKYVKNYINSADICVVPDQKNGLNEYLTIVKVAEYMSFAKPIVAYDLIETKYTTGKSAIIIKNNDHKKFGDAIKKLCENKKLRYKLGRIGKKRLEKDFTWEKSEIKLLKFYDKIVKERNLI